MRTTTLIATLVLMPFLTAGVQAGGDAAAGKTKAAPCAGCHGADGNSPSPLNPNMAGQKEQYLVTTMMDYKNGKRQHAVMQAFLAPLSEQDIQDMAAFYASQKCK